MCSWTRIAGRAVQEGQVTQRQFGYKEILPGPIAEEGRYVTGKDFYYYYWLQILYIYIYGERERDAWICCSTYICIHWLILTCALTEDRTCNLGVLGWHPNQRSYPAKAKGKIYILGKKKVKNMKTENKMSLHLLCPMSAAFLCIFTS